MAAIRWRLRTGIPSTGIVREDPHDVENHSETVTELPHGAGRMVRAPHRHFDNAVGPAPGNAEDLDVESESVEPLHRKQRAGGRAAERLEPALGVVQIGHSGRPYEPVEQAAEGLAQRLLLSRFARFRQ